MLGELWGDIVPDFASTKLTYDGDILPSLSRLGNLMQVFSPGMYLAGVWQVDLHSQLAWRPLLDKDLCRQGSLYTAPSFSWAARTGDVVFSQKFNIYRACSIIVDFVKHMEMMLLGELHTATSIQMGNGHRKD